MKSSEIKSDRLTSWGSVVSLLFACLFVFVAFMHTAANDGNAAGFGSWFKRFFTRFSGMFMMNSSSHHDGDHACSLHVSFLQPHSPR
jgi:hypothetical protein